MVSDEVLENAIKSYKVARESALDGVVYECLKELKKYRELGTYEELNETLEDYLF